MLCLSKHSVERNILLPVVCFCHFTASCLLLPVHHHLWVLGHWQQGHSLCSVSPLSLLPFENCFLRPSFPLLARDEQLGKSFGFHFHDLLAQKMHTMQSFLLSPHHCCSTLVGGREAKAAQRQCRNTVFLSVFIFP